MRLSVMTFVSSAKAHRTLFLIVKGVVVFSVLPVLGLEQERNVLEPADWRWSVPQLCQSRLTGRFLTRRRRTRRSSEVETSLTVGAFSYDNDRILRNCEHSEAVECLVLCSESLQLPATNLRSR